MIAAVIPTRYHPPELGNLLTILLADGVPQTKNTFTRHPRPAN